MKYLITFLFFCVAILFLPMNPVWAAGDYCAASRVINQWGCNNTQIDLCNSKFSSTECPFGETWCGSHPNCWQPTSYQCKVIYDGNSPCGGASCETNDSFNDCAEGASWKSSCSTFNAAKKQCYVLAYSCSGSSCVRDSSNGTHYNDTCDNACTGGGGGGGGGGGNSGCDGSCSTDADCQSGLSCKPNGHPGCWGNACDAPSCNNNGIQDNGETGVDCGGGNCPACSSPPTCGLMTAPSCINKDGTITVQVANVQNATSVHFYPWSDAGGQDDITDANASNIGNGVWQANILESFHRGGNIQIHGYAYNNAGNKFCDGKTVTVPCDITIQGNKVEWDASQNKYVSTSFSAGQTTTINGGTPLTGNPYSYYVTSNSNQSVSVTVPNNCTVGFTQCNNDTTCHTTANVVACNGVSSCSCSGGVCTQPVNPNTVKSSFDVYNDPFSYADLWWHYQCTPSCASITIPNGTTLTSQTSGLLTFTIHGVLSASTVKLRASNGAYSVTATAVPAGGSNYTATVNMGDTNLFNDPISIEGLVSNLSYTDLSSCSMNLRRQVAVTGQLYNDNGATTVPTSGATGTNCSYGGGPAPTGTGLPAGASIKIGGTCPNGGLCQVTAGGAITMSQVSLKNTAQTFTISPIDPSLYVWGCPNNGTHSIIAPFAAGGYNFYLTNVSDPWWQSIGGNVMAEGENTSGSNAIRSFVPTVCSSPTTCKVLRTVGGTANTSGYASIGSRGAGNTIITAGAPTTLTALNEENKNTYSEMTRAAAKQDYAYFYNLFQLGTNPPPTSVGPLNGLVPANLTPTTQTAYYASGTVTINSNWAIGANKKIVVFIANNGDLNINANITVPTSSFLAFIVSGNINIGSGVGQSSASSETPVVEGMYVANGTFSVNSTGDPTTEKRFVGAGTFVGWDDVSLGRDMGIGNNNNATELFIARPDFALNAPNEMKKAVYDWQEIAP